MGRPTPTKSYKRTQKLPSPPSPGQCTPFRSNCRIFAAADGRMGRLLFTDSSGCYSVRDGMAEKIPVEPGQGNACAGKVKLHFNFLLRSITSFITHNQLVTNE